MLQHVELHLGDVEAHSAATMAVVDLAGLFSPSFSSPSLFSPLPSYPFIHFSSTNPPEVRSLYRLIEFALGIDGYPFTHEWIFYVFEALPMVPAIAIFCCVHPAKYLGRDGGKTPGNKEEEGAEMGRREGRARGGVV